MFISKKKTYPDLINNFSNLRLKTHVQHSVSFIQYKVGAPAEVCLSSLKEVNQSSWSCNADFHTWKEKKSNKPKI